MVINYSKLNFKKTLKVSKMYYTSRWCTFCAYFKILFYYINTGLKKTNQINTNHNQKIT